MAEKFFTLKREILICFPYQLRTNLETLTFIKRLPWATRAAAAWTSGAAAAS
jgi:hypothetical protein